MTTKITLVVVLLTALLSIASLKTFSDGLEGWKSDSDGRVCSRYEVLEVSSPTSIFSSSNANNSSGPLMEVEAEPVSPILPRRQITVFGLESSGTTFLAKTLASVADVKFREGSQKNQEAATALNRSLEVAHISQPWGFHCERNNRPPVLPALYPAACGERRTTGDGRIARSRKSFSASPDVLQPATPQCKDLGVTDNKHRDKALVYPVRYFVNITSHVEWYRSRGVDATAVVVLRDKSIGHYARYLEHCSIAEEVEADEKLGLSLIEEALDRLPTMYPYASSPPVVMVQYESLLLLGEFYLRKLLRELRLPSDVGSVPQFKNGNEKYIKEYNVLYKQKQETRAANRFRGHSLKLGSRLKRGTTLEDNLINPPTKPVSGRLGRHHREFPVARMDSKEMILNKLRSRGHLRDLRHGS